MNGTSNGTRDFPHSSSSQNGNGYSSHLNFDHHRGVGDNNNSYPGEQAPSSDEVHHNHIRGARNSHDRYHSNNDKDSEKILSRRRKSRSRSRSRSRTRSRSRSRSRHRSRSRDRKRGIRRYSRSRSRTRSRSRSSRTRRRTGTRSRSRSRSRSLDRSRPNSRSDSRQHGSYRGGGESRFQGFDNRGGFGTGAAGNRGDRGSDRDRERKRDLRYLQNPPHRGGRRPSFSRSMSPDRRIGNGNRGGGGRRGRSRSRSRSREAIRRSRSRSNSPMMYHHRARRDRSYSRSRDRGGHGTYGRPYPDDHYGGGRGGFMMGRGGGGRGGPHGDRGYHDYRPGPGLSGPGGGSGGGRQRGRYDETPPGVSLLVRNLHSDVKSSDLESAFRRIGTIKDVYIPLDYHSQQPKGFAFVEYATHEEAKTAKEEMNRFLLKGRELEVVFAQEKRKSAVEMRTRSGNVGGGGNFDKRRPHEEDRRRGMPSMDRGGRGNCGW